jgi:hypothetical protein
MLGLIADFLVGCAGFYKYYVAQQVEGINFKNKKQF